MKPTVQQALLLFSFLAYSHICGTKLTLSGECVNPHKRSSPWRALACLKPTYEMGLWFEEIHHALNLSCGLTPLHCLCQVTGETPFL